MKKKTRAKEGEIWFDQLVPGGNTCARPAPDKDKERRRIHEKMKPAKAKGEKARELARVKGKIISLRKKISDSRTFCPTKSETHRGEVDLQEAHLHSPPE